MHHHVYGTYNMVLVLFSYLVATVASYTVLDLIGRISTSRGMQRWGWVAFGAVGMGLGVWSMHFVGMLAFSLSTSVAYDLNMVILSVLVVIAAAFVALIIVGQSKLSFPRLLAGGMLLATGISVMHYTGMAAMQIDITYKPFYFALSIVIAIIASNAALWLAFYLNEGKLNKILVKLASSLIMGAAVVGMHYTGMHAAQFQLRAQSDMMTGIMLDQTFLPYLIVIATLFTLGLSIFGIYISNRFSKKDSEFLQNERWYKSLFENNQDGIISVDRDLRIIDHNAAITNLTGLPGSWFRGNSISGLLPFIAEDALEGTQGMVRKSLDGEMQNYSSAIINQSGHRIDLNVINVPVSVNGQIVGSYVIAKDVTEEKAAKEKIQHLAFHDELTGLPNRRWFNRELEQMIERASGRFTVMVMDMDRFKLINDSLGHTYGDLFLQEVSRRIEDCLSGYEMTLSRMGGDEFTLLCDGRYEKEEITGVTERIIETVAVPYRLKENDFYVTVSIGISAYPEDGEDPVQLLKNADTAMYEVKKNGKNGYQFYTRELHAQLQEKIELEGDLRQALAHGQLFLDYQPQADAETNQIIGVEALVRWLHPKKGVLSPGVFIPIAEETGMIYELGTWVLREACRQMKEWHDGGGPLITVSVNLSSQQFHQANLTKYIKDILEETGLESRYLELEITESMMMDPNVSSGILNELSESGIRISLDDFGTGYSSLSYLKLLPIHKLKIDRSFIRDITENVNDKAIVATIISMAKHLNMDVIAEGIETKEQLDILVDNHCSEIQGYYYSKPLSATDMEAMFLSGKVLVPLKSEQV
ncbi:PAS domain S-box-containing protein/diguanylate cyclase (GGDEF)-like protein [Paenibacillus taihuensis]|uniref:PAS domain S-box-containing protein/diguanylate cyclase (GGDEF)-like protein n=1 Tax=Paenibacillus taihuensis TaxID=1156355 RepID=A0A3D9SNE8_9BACL|nr:EAL domain-containing protein [Paenibacillus taihuensis]REE93054.1 PAS domain S-box-containing protein/diguanylate cyclase (GGDEF)-like protein [Paenibacillus taihuensis]